MKNAKAKGFPAIALTDKNVMYGAVAFYKECLKQSIKPIIGLTVDVESDITITNSYPLVLLAENQTGFQNLLKISSAVQTRSEKGIPIKWLKHYASGLIALTPGSKGEIETLLINREHDQAKQLGEKFKGIFGSENFFLSLQNHQTKEDLELIESLKRLGEISGIPLVCTNQVHYLEQEDAFAHECLLAIKQGVKLSDDDRERLENNEYDLKSAKQMTELFAEIPDALENTLKIADRCNVQLKLNQKMLPKYPITDGLSSEHLLERLCIRRV